MKNKTSSQKKSITSFVNPFSREYDFFLTCVDSGSVVKAAESLGIQQAGLSKVIQKLEHEVGQKLFFRNARGIEPTEFGRALYHSLLQAKVYWEGIYSNQVQSSLGPSGPFKIGCHPSVAVSQYPRLLPPLIRSFPALQVAIEFDTSLEITRKVATLKVDVGLVINPVKNADLILRPIATEEVRLWRAHEKANSVLVYNPDMFQGAKLLKKFPGFTLQAVKDYEVIAELVKHTDFVGLLPSSVGERHQLKPVGDKLMSVNLAMIWHKDKFVNESRYQIIESILKSLKN